MNNNETVSTQNESTNSNNRQPSNTVSVIKCAIVVAAAAVATAGCVYIISEHPGCEASFSVGGKESLFSVNAKSNNIRRSEEKVSS